MLELEHFPFSVGISNTPNNGTDIPDVFPFKLLADLETGLIMQKGSPRLEEQLKNAYEKGSLLGTAMDDTDIGRGYALDFIKFIEGHMDLSCAPTILEFGAGRGYLLYLLKERGATVVGLEPGKQNQHYWDKYDVPVHCDFFPSSKVEGDFDAIISYAVIEHIEDLSPFFEKCKKQLTPEKGMVIFAVPDTEEAIQHGDPSMLLHEHYNYFTRNSLNRLLSLNGLEPVTVAKSNYGGAIYISARPTQDTTSVRMACPLTDSEKDLIQNYGSTVIAARKRLQDKLTHIDGTIGIYCPARALGLLPLDMPLKNVRFFDDDPDLLGKYYPPFPVAVENRHMLQKAPVDELWIMSWTFGEKLKTQLQSDPNLKETRLLTISDFFNVKA